MFKKHRKFFEKLSLSSSKAKQKDCSGKPDKAPKKNPRQKTGMLFISLPLSGNLRRGYLRFLRLDRLLSIYAIWRCIRPYFWK